MRLIIAALALLALSIPAQAGIISGARPNPGVYHSSRPVAEAGGGGGSTCGTTISMFQSTGAFRSSAASSLVATATTSVVAGHTIVVGIVSDADVVSSTQVTDNKGNVYRLVQSYNAASFANIGIYTSTNIGTGGSNFQVTYNRAFPGFSSLAFLEVEGLSCTGDTDGSATGTGTGSTAQTSEITTTATDLIVSVTGFDDGIDVQNINPGAGFTRAYQVTDNANFLAFQMQWRVAASGAYTPSTTFQTGTPNWFIAATALK